MVNVQPRYQVRDHRKYGVFANELCACADGTTAINSEIPGSLGGFDGPRLESCRLLCDLVWLPVEHAKFDVVYVHSVVTPDCLTATPIANICNSPIPYTRQ